MAILHYSALITLLFSVFGSNYAQVSIIGNCPDIPVVSPFNVADYLGQWYEIERYFTPFQIGAICAAARYADFGNGSVEVYNTQIEGISGNFSFILGSARLANSNSTEAKLLVNFPSIGNFDAPYWVLDTDYTNYSIVWSCRNTGANSLQTIWYLARTRNPGQWVRGYVRGFLKALRLNTDYLRATEQFSCSDLD